jgi:hypothetical protein
MTSSEVECLQKTWLYFPFKTKRHYKNANTEDLLRLFPTSPLEVAASFRRTIPMVIAASILVVKETVEIDANKTYQFF